MKNLSFLNLFLTSFFLPINSFAQSLGSYPASATCESDRQTSYNQGYSLGYAAGDSNGYYRGYPLGLTAGVTQCINDPQSCHISLSSCIPEPVAGETEPNDNLIAADPIQFLSSYHAQLSSVSDQDWYMVETNARNQNLLVTFSVPGADLAGSSPGVWNITIRDAAGNIFANFDSTVGDLNEGTKDTMTYGATLGLVGTYYIVIQAAKDLDAKGASKPFSQSPYWVMANLQDTPLDSQQPIVGFYDTEIEPNNFPSQATPIATGVSMYGLINLTFQEVTDPTKLETVWAQGEDDWYVYKSNGNELITLSFCAKDVCSSGNWFVEVYNQTDAQLINEGTPLTSLTPLFAVNTNVYDSNNKIVRVDGYHIGLRDPGYYFMRVNQARYLTALCTQHRYVNTSQQFVTGTAGICSCESGSSSASGASCYIPTSACSEEGSTLLCKIVTTTTCKPGLDPGCWSADGQDGRPRLPANCPITDPTTGEVKTACDIYQTQALCSCSNYSGVIAVPAGSDKIPYTSQYNFTWFGTQLPPNTIDTDAYQDFLNRLNPYN